MIEIVEVVWIDTQAVKGDTNNWMEADVFLEWCKTGPVICRSVGYLTYEADDYIVISQTIFEDDRAENTMIPRANIKEISVFPPLGNTSDGKE